MASPIDWTSVKALSFDIFGTLVDWESGIYDAARASAVGPYLPSRSETLNGIDDHDVEIQSQNPTMLQCDVIAEGVVAAVKQVGLKVPLVVRLEGTNVEAGKKIISESGLNVVSADNLDDAAQKIVKAVKGG